MLVHRVYWLIKVLSVWHIFLLQWTSCNKCPTLCTCKEELFGRITNCSGPTSSSEDMDLVLRNIPSETTNLYLYHMDTSRFPEAIQLDAPQLTVLYIRHGGVSSFHESLRFISSTVNSKLTVMDLTGNRLTTLMPDEFHNFTKLERLVLSDNRISRIYSGAFTNLPQLRELDLSNNHLRKIYSNAFIGLTSLQLLDLSNNPIRGQIRNSKLFMGLGNLLTLKIRNCSLELINNKSFADMKKLQFLHLERNSLLSVPVGALATLPELLGLFIKENRIRFLPKDLSKLKSLKYIELSSNNISSVHPMSLSGMEHLQELYLDNNKIETLPPEIEVYFKYLTKINILENPWLCDCRLLWLGRWMRNQTSAVFSPVCRWPRNILLRDIHLQDMRCPNNRQSLYVQCMQSAWSASACPLCPPFSQVQGGVGTCACVPGYDGITGTNCTACPVGFFKSVVGPDSCAPCPEGSTTMSEGSSVCFCKPGWTMRQGKCRECLRNTYKSHYGQHECVKCRPHAQSPEQSTGPHMCVCEKPASEKDNLSCQDPYPTSNTFVRPPEKEYKVYMNQDSIMQKIYVPMGIASFLSATCIIIVITVCCRRRRSRYSQLMLASRNNGVKMLHTSPEECKFTDGRYFLFEGRYADWTNITVKRLKIGRLLGRGAFGNVHEGFAYGPGISDSHPLCVAVKRLKDSATEDERQAFKTELEQMRLLGNHTNIIGLVGSCILNGQMAIIMEYAKLGNLLTYLKEKSAKLENYVSIMPDGAIAEERARQITEETELMLFAWQIARGMAHLESLKCVHRDLASRNVLIAAGPIAKISDFGLARDVYENGYYFRASKGRLPYKWLSPEALLWGQYSTKSDVWSFGVVLWEIATLGGSPYPGVPADHLADLHRSGYRMSQPPNCPDKLYNIIDACWKDDPRQRPPFFRLADILDQLLLGAAEREYLSLETGPKGTLQCLEREILCSEQHSLSDYCKDSRKIPADMVTSLDSGDTSTSGYASSHAGYYT